MFLNKHLLKNVPNLRYFVCLGFSELPFLNQLKEWLSLHDKLKGIELELDEIIPDEFHFYPSSHLETLFTKALQPY